MKVILSPAKKMVRADDDFAYRDLPVYLKEAETLLKELRSYDASELKKIWNCSDKLLKENMARLEQMDLRSGLSPAVFSYVGLAYQHMAPGALTDQGLAWLQEHLRILSGFYGILKPFDGITPYRLEMQAVLPETGRLYDFWNHKLYDAIADEEVINLASKEYSDAVLPFVKKKAVTAVFAELNNSRLKQKGTLAKMARGEMVYWLAENGIEKAEDMKAFRNGWTFSEEHSDETTYVFLKKEVSE